MTGEATTGLELRTLMTAEGALELSLQRVSVPEPAADQVVVRVEATPINPSDLGLLLGPVDPSRLRSSGTGDAVVVTGEVPQGMLKAFTARLGESMPVGNEGAGTVVRTGSSEAARALQGKLVAMIGGAMYAQYRVIRAADCLVLPNGVTAAQGASCYVNPLTSLGMTGRLAGQILTAMEAAINRSAATYSRYGSNVHKQVYIYGSLDPGPIELARGVGMAWGVGGWLLFPFLQKIGAADGARLRQRVLDELTTTFASHYTRTVSLRGALSLDNIAVYGKRATGAKYLIDPSLPD